MKRALFFVIAGGTGFAVDAGMLALLLAITPLGPFIARVLAIATAMAATWMINRRFTFGKSRHSLVAEGSRYGGVGLFSALVNFALYSALILTFPHLWPVAAVAVSSGLSMAVSYLGYSRLVFDRQA